MQFEVCEVIDFARACKLLQLQPSSGVVRCQESDIIQRVPVLNVTK